MSEWKWMKANTLQKSIAMTHARFDPSRPFLSFEIEIDNTPIVLVQFNHKGWVSDWTESNEEYSLRCAKARRLGNEAPMRWSSSYLKNTDDYHILACKMWLRRTYSEELKPTSHHRQMVKDTLEAALQATSFSRG